MQIPNTIWPDLKLGVDPVSFISQECLRTSRNCSWRISLWQFILYLRNLHTVTNLLQLLIEMMKVWNLTFEIWGYWIFLHTSCGLSPLDLWAMLDSGNLTLNPSTATDFLSDLGQFIYSNHWLSSLSIKIKDNVFLPCKGAVKSSETIVMKRKKCLTDIWYPSPTESGVAWRKLALLLSVPCLFCG